MKKFLFLLLLLSLIRTFASKPNKRNEMKLKIAVLAGDGIGPEIMEQGVAVLSAVARKCGHDVT